MPVSINYINKYNNRDKFKKITGYEDYPKLPKRICKLTYRIDRKTFVRIYKELDDIITTFGPINTRTKDFLINIGMPSDEFYCDFKKFLKITSSIVYQIYNKDDTEGRSRTYTWYKPPLGNTVINNHFDLESAGLTRLAEVYNMIRVTCYCSIEETKVYLILVNQTQHLRIL